VAQVTLTNVEKFYPGGIPAVKNANLVINDKEFVVLVGPSGCGKSTTLRMIAGLEEISGGEIRIDGCVVNDVPPKDRDIAMVFQNYALYPHKNVYKNMSFGLEMRRYPKDEIDRRVRDAAEILGITDLLQRRPKALSGGQRQRVAVGRAIVRKPKVFLFDEPLSNLDAKLRVQMRAEISKLHRRLQSTMIYVTHDQVEAMTMGDRIVVMLDGVIQQVDAPLDLYHRPANKFVATFIGSPPMNILEGRIDSHGDGLAFHTSGNAFVLPLPSEYHGALTPFKGKEVYLGIRPEDLQDASESAVEPGEILEALVEVVEPMGSEIYVYLSLAGQPIAARVHALARPEVGHPYALRINTAGLHFFDRASEEAIR
jgi:multiple sugar transport system ATP-binding protein